MRNKHAYRRGHRHRWKVAGVLAPVAAAVIVAAGVAPAAASTPSAGGIAGNAQWLMYSGTVGQIDSLDNSTPAPNPSAASVTKAAFDNSNTIFDVTGTLPWTPTQGFIPFYAYSNNGDNGEPVGAVQRLSDCQAHPPFPPGTYLMYDNEDDSMTPAAEQQDPAGYEAEFVALAHDCGYKAVLAPALDLVYADQDLQGSACYQPDLGVSHVADENDVITYAMNYLGTGQCNLAADAGAAAPDVYLIQAEDLTPDNGSSCEADDSWVNYCGFVKQAAGDAQAADSSATPMKVIAEVDSTGKQPGYGAFTATGTQLYDDALSTWGPVQGYMLITPGGNNPAAAYDFLVDLGY